MFIKLLAVVRTVLLLNTGKSTKSAPAAGGAAAGGVLVPFIVGTFEAFGVMVSPEWYAVIVAAVPAVTATLGVKLRKMAQERKP